MSELGVGQTIELADGRIAIVRYIGQPHFATGDWVGVELEDGSGKNDGSVQGERYFDCEMGRGMFVRPTAVASIREAAPQRPAAGNGLPKRGSRPSSVVAAGGKRLSSVTDAGAGKRMSMNAASPSPANRLSRPSGTLRVCCHQTHQRAKIDANNNSHLRNLLQNSLDPQLHRLHLLLELQHPPLLLDPHLR